MESMENTENIKRMTEYIAKNLENTKSIESVITDLKITGVWARATIQKNNQITGSIDEVYYIYYQFAKYKPEPYLEKILKEKKCWRADNHRYYEEIVNKDMKRGRKTRFMDEKEAIKCYGENPRRIVNLDIEMSDSMENSIITFSEFKSLPPEQTENIDEKLYRHIKNEVIEQRVRMKSEKALPSHHSEQIEPVRNPPVQGI